MSRTIRRFADPLIAFLAGGGLEVSGFEDIRVAVALWIVAGAWGLALFTGEPVKKRLFGSRSQSDIYREGTVATIAGQGRLFSIELPMSQAVLRQLRVTSSKSCVFMVVVCENANNPISAMHSNMGIFQSHGRVVQETFRLPDYYYEDKDGGTHLHLEITPLIDQYLMPPTLVEFKVGVWFTSISQ